jgi:phospholipid/cholesterol/gamma-HCH transport system substrate-binding protein
VYPDRGEPVLISHRRFARHSVWVPLLAALLLGSCTASCARKAEPAASPKFCVLLSDAIGLYTGNPVTQMGFPIGTVKSIQPEGTRVQVDFTIDRKRPIPADVRAVIRSPSILADRSLELVGNYAGGPQLLPDDCIPLNRSSTPLSISRIVGSATDFVNAISPDGSTNLQDALRGVNKATQGTGKSANELLNRASSLLDNPDQTVADLGEITKNMAELTTMLRDNRDPLKQILQDMPTTGSDIDKAVAGASHLAHPLPEVIQLVEDLELELGPELQLALDTVSEDTRILAPHYKGIADLLNPLPRFISGLNGEPPGATAGALAKHINNHVFDLLTWRPPLFRVPTPNGLLACGMMNSSLPGTCADIGGRPYAVDTALLQYVLTVAANQ